MNTNLRFLLSIVGIFLALNLSAQRGALGSQTITNPDEVVNTYTQLNGNAAVGATSIFVTDNVMTGGAFGGTPLGPGDLILIIQMYGGTVDINTWYYQNGWGPYTVPSSYSTTWGSNPETFGQMLTYQQVGYFERAEVVGTSGSTIQLSCGLEHAYNGFDGVQVVRIPRYDDLTVNSGASIVPTLWDGTTGGIVALEVDGTLTLNSNATISASGYGYRGGQVDGFFTPGAATTSAPQERFLGSPNGDEGSEKGESIYGFYTEYDALFSRYGKGAIGNGGGGGGYVNTGGGGGSNAEVAPAAYNGHGNPVGYAAAWALDPSVSSSSGGGRGGYALSQNALNPLTVGPDDGSWGGDARKNNGGWGGHPIPYDPDRIYFGGGGGAGEQDSDQGGSGGRGGGIVYIVNYGDMTGSGTIEVNGEAGQNSNPNNETPGFGQYKGNDGAGGGGAGGTVYIENATAIPGTININADGGAGGDQNLLLFSQFQQNEAGGPGGSGSGGVIRFSSGAPTQSVTAGANGVTTSTQMTNFPPNGATTGSSGEANLPAPYYDLIPVHDTICAGQSANPAVTVSGSYSGTLNWYTMPTGGSPIAGQTNQLTYNVSPGTTTSYWVGVCPGSFRVEVIVTVTSGANLVTTDPTPVCAPATVDITAPAVTAGSDAGTLTYWQDNLATVSQPTPTAVGGGWHYIQLDAGGGCTAIDSVFVTVNPLDDASFNYGAATYCTSDSDPTPTITGLAGGTFTSAPAGLSINSSTGLIDVSASTPNTYTVTYTTSGPCPNSSDVSVTITAQDDATFSYPAATYCVNDVDPTPTATTGGGTYTASPAGLSINASTGVIDVSASTPNAYTVTYTTAGACPNSSTFNVTINALDDASFNYSAATYCTSDPDPIPTITGLGGGTFTSAPAGLSINASTGAIDVSASTPNVYTVTYTTAGACPNSSNVSVTITTQDDATFSYPAATYCVNDVDPTPTAATGGGTYTASPVGLSINASTGVIDVSASTANAYTVTYTTAGACPNSSTFNVTINALDDASFNYSAATYCTNDPDPTPTITGLAGGTFTSAPAGLSINASTGAIDVSASTPNVYTVTYTTAGACPNSSNVSVTINALDDASFSYSAGTYCTNDADPTPTITGLGGGSFTSAPAGLSINSTTGVIDVSASTPNTYTVTYTTSGACPNSSNVSVTITPLDDATFNSFDFCASSVNTISGVATPGGTFAIQSQTGSMGVTIDPSTGILSNYVAGDQVTIEYTTPAGACQNTSTQTVTVTNSDDPSFTTGDFCASAVNTISAVATPGGTFSITSQTGSATIDPSTGVLSGYAAGDQVTIQYATPAGGCQDSSTQVVNVLSLDDPTFASADFCASGVNTISSVATPGGTFSITTQTGTATIDPSTGILSGFAGGDQITIQYVTPAGGCQDSSTQVVNVNPTPVITTTPTPISACNADDGQIAVADGGNASGAGVVTWTGPVSGNSGTVIVPYSITALPPGTYDVTFTDNATGCTSVAVQETFVNPGAPDIDPIAAMSDCDSVQLPAITGTNLTGSQAYFDGPNGTGTQYAAGDWISSTITLYAYDVNGTCTDEEMFTVTIHTIPVAAFTANPTSGCALPHTVFFTDNSTLPDTWLWDFGDLNTSTAQNPIHSYTAFGTFTVTLTVTDTIVGCSDTATTTITVNTAPILDPVADASGCDSVQLAPITGSNLSGNEAYYTGTGGTGTMYNPGDWVMTGGTYYAYDASNVCSNEESLTVTVNASPTVSGPTAVCSGASIVLSGTGTPDGATPWASSNNGIATVDNVGNVTGVAAGTATITYLDANGCSNTYDVTVVTTPDVNAVTNLVGCDSVQLAPITGTNLSGNQAYYSGTGGTGTVYNAGDWVTAGGTYYAYDGASGCSDEEMFTVTINVSPTVSGPTDVCEGASIALNGTGTPDGATPWASSNTSVATVDNVGNVTGVAAGTTTITYLDANGCSNTYDVTVNALPTISGTPTVCVGASTALTGSGTPNGATPWASSNTAVVTVDNAGNVTGVAAGSATITYMNDLGCTVDQSVTVNALDDPSFTSSDFCESTVNTISAVATPGGTFSITSQTGSATIDPSTGVLAGFAGGDQITIQYLTPAAGCQDSSTVTVNVTPLDDASFTSADFCEASTNTISNVATPGGTFAIQSQTGAATIDPSTGILSGFAAGDQITIEYTTPAGGCQNTSTVTVNVTAQDDASFTTSDFCASSTNTISNVVTPGGTYTIQSQTGTATIDPATGILSNVAAGDQITIEYTTPAGACQNTSTQVVNVIPDDDGTFAMTATCDGGTALVSGLAGGTFTFTTAPGDGAAIDAATGTVSNGTGGMTYSVDYTTNGTCPVTTTQTVTVLDQDDATFMLTPTCDGATAFVSGTSGGTFTLISLGGETIDPATGTVTGGDYNAQIEVQYTTSGACPDSTTEIAIIDDCTPNDVIIPTAITPGSDGANDTWEIVSLDNLYPDNSVTVYNRWGNKVFEHQSSATDPYNANQWDGTFKGQMLPIASYYFIIEANDGSGTKFEGTVTILQ